MAKDSGKSTRAAGAPGGAESGKKASRVERAQARAARRAARRERNATIRQAFAMTRKGDPTMLPILIAIIVGVLAVFVALGLLFDVLFIAVGLALPLAALAGMFFFSRRAQSVAMRQVEGQLGAAAAVTENMRGNWRTTPAVAFTQQQDLVHRVIGRPGVVLVTEGSPSRTEPLVRAERKRLQRLLGNVPVYDVSVGDASGQVSVRNLQRHLSKLPKNITPAQVNEVDRRLTAIGNTGLPIPKGPMPRSARAARQQRR